MEPLTGLDAAFPALEMETTRAHVAGMLVLGPPDSAAAAALLAPGGQHELEALVGEVMSRSLDPDRPLWRMVVVGGGSRTGTRRCSAALRWWHNAAVLTTELADGVAAPRWSVETVARVIAAHNHELTSEDLGR